MGSSSLASGGTCAPCSGSVGLNRWTAREALILCLHTFSYSYSNKTSVGRKRTHSPDSALSSRPLAFSLESINFSFS